MPTRIRTPPADAVIRQLAARQWGVVSRRQLLDARLTAAMVGERVRAGRLLPLHPGVYAVGHTRLRREGHWLAAVLAVGPDAALSHRDAAGLHDLRPADHARIDVTTTADHRNTVKLRVHRTRSLDAQDITTVHGIPVTTVAVRWSTSPASCRATTSREPSRRRSDATRSTSARSRLRRRGREAGEVRATEH